MGRRLEFRTIRGLRQPQCPYNGRSRPSESSSDLNGPGGVCDTSVLKPGDLLKRATLGWQTGRLVNRDDIPERIWRGVGCSWYVGMGSGRRELVAVGWWLLKYVCGTFLVWLTQGGGAKPIVSEIRSTSSTNQTNRTRQTP